MCRVIILSLAVLLASTTALRADQFFQPAAPGGNQLWVPQLFVSGHVGDERTIGGLDLTWPLTQRPDALLFANARLRTDTEDALEANLGLGYRFQLNSDVILGCYGYFDSLRSQNENSFTQATFGAELLMEDWQLRGNVYLPESRIEHVVTTFANAQPRITGTSIALIGQNFQETALPGFDAELGRRINFLADMIDRQMFGQVWLYGGYYRFDDDGFDSIEGPRIRGEWRLPTDSLVRGSYLSLGGQWQHDDVRGDQTFFTVFFRMPLGGTTTTRHRAMRDMGWRYWAMQTPVVRDVDVVTTTRALEATAPAYNASNGEELNHVYFASAYGTAAATGAHDDPLDLATALTRASANDMIVAIGKTPINTGRVLISSGVTLVGGGTSIAVGTKPGATFDNSANLALLHVPGDGGVLYGTDSHLIRLADNARDITVGNITLRNLNGDAIVGRNNQNVLMGALTINKTAASAIDYQGGRDLTLNSVTTTKSGDTSVVLRNLRGNVGVHSLTTTQAAGGMIVDDVRGNVTFSSINLTADSGNGLTITNSAGMTWSGTNAVSATDGYALRAANSEFTSTAFSSLTSTNSPTYGVLVTGTRGSFTASGTIAITNPGSTGLIIRDLNHNDASVTFGSIRVTNSPSQGVRVANLTADNVSVTLGNTDVNKTDSYGLLVRNATGDTDAFSLSSLTTQNTHMAGLHVEDFTGTISTGALTVNDVDNDSGIVLMNNTADITTGAITIDGPNTNGLVISGLDGSFTTNNAAITVSNVSGAALLLTNLSAADLSITTGAVTTTTNVATAAAAVQIDALAATATNASITIGNVTADETTNAVAIYGSAADGLSITIGNINSTTTVTGVLIDGDFSDSAQLTLGNVTLEDATGNGLNLINIDGANLDFTIGDLDLTNPGANGMRINNFLAGTSTLTVGTVNVDSPTNDGVLIDGISGDNNTFQFGDTTVTSPGNVAQEQLNDTGAGNTINFDSVTTN